MDLSNQLLNYGIAGIFILVLLYALNKVTTLYIEAQEQRIADKESIVVVTRNSTEAINGITRAVEVLTEIVKNR